MKSSSFRTASTLAAVALGAGMSAQAATMAWTGASSTAFDVTTNWDGGFPATPNLGTIGTTGDTVGPYSVNIVNRDTIVNTNITVYGTSTITAQGAPRRSWALTLRDYSKFLPLDGTLDTVASSGGSGVFIDIHDHAEWTGWDRQQDANTTVNLYDDGKFQFNRWYAGDANIYGGTFTVGDITGFASTDNILLNLGPGSTGSLTIATYTKAMYETLYAATDAEDRLRYNGSNTAPFDSVFMVTGNTRSPSFPSRHRQRCWGLRFLPDYFSAAAGIHQTPVRRVHVGLKARNGRSPVQRCWQCGHRADSDRWLEAI